MDRTTHSVINLTTICAITLLLHSQSCLLSENDSSNHLSSSVSFHTSHDEIINFTNAGSDGIALIGEPLHLGDTAIASSLVHNSGNIIDSARLIVEDLTTGYSFYGEYVEIMPGSSKELSVTFLPDIAGDANFKWYVNSPNGGIDINLNGSFSLQISEPQSLMISSESYSWDLSNPLEAQISLYLSDGVTRPIMLQIYGDSNQNNLLYSSKLTLDPGYRTISMNLGDPDYSYLFIEVIPLSWGFKINDSQNFTYLEIIKPFVNIEINFDSYYPQNPSYGENITFNYNVKNLGNSASSSAKIRILMPDLTIIHEENISPLSAGSSYYGVIMIQNWNYDQLVNISLVWMSDTHRGEDWILVTPSISERSSGYDIDYYSLFYGSVAGLFVVLFTKVSLGAVSHRTPSTTSESKIRPPRGPRISKTNPINNDKIEVSCPLCEQRLNVPSLHQGLVHCPSCNSNFNVEGANASIIDMDLNQIPKIADNSDSATDQQETTVSSDGDMLDCPVCSQKLKIPLEKRPVRARCPACRSEFMATENGE